MTRVQEYWRDRLMAILGWQSVASLVLDGWLTSFGQNMELYVLWSEARDGATPRVVREDFLRAIALLVGTACAGGFVTYVVHRIHRKWLSEDVDDTVLPHRVVVSYALGLAIIMVILVAFVAVT